MLAWRVALAFVAVFLPAVISEDGAAITHQIQGRIAYQNGNPLPPTKVSLNGGEYEALTRVDGGFTFHDVQPGIHLLDVLSLVGFFSQVKVNLPSDPEGKVKCLEYKYPGAPKEAMPYPLELTPHFKLQHFEARPQVSVVRMLMGNPMVLMMGVMVLMLTVFPKMMGGDAMKEFQEQQAEMQAQMGDTSNPMEMFSKILSGGDLGQAAAPQQDKPRVQQQGASSGGSTKRSKKDRG